MFATHQLRIGGLDRQLAELLAAELGVTVVLDDVESLGPHAKRRYRPDTRTLHVARWLDSGQRAFQMATSWRYSPRRSCSPRSSPPTST